MIALSHLPSPSASTSGGSGHARGHIPGSPAAGAVLRGFADDVGSLLRIPTFTMLGVAWAMHTATIGCFSYYGPKAAKELFALDAADTVFGALTVVTGILGTLMGGMLLDRWKCALISSCSLAGFLQV